MSRSLVCFDLPCLVSVPAHVPAEAMDRALRRLGLEPASPLHASCVARPPAWPGRAAQLQLLDSIGSPVWAEAAAAAYDDAFGGVVARSGAALRPGAARLLALLKEAGTPISLMTTFSAATREAVLDVLPWEGTALLVSDDLVGPRPRSAVQLACEALGLEPHALVVVADCPVVLGGGVALGAAGIGLLGTGGSAHELLLAGATDLLSLSDFAGDRALVPA
jgi:beta-phosphoglucomutase-like phosphatase (HAD superfamily)